MTKRCSKCKEVKDRSEFYKDKSRKDGLRPYCKDCKREEMAVYRAANTDKAALYAQAYSKANAAKIRARRAAWAKANAERIRAYNISWREANPERHSANRAAWAKANPEKVRGYNSMRRALRAGASVGYLPSNYRTILFNFYGNKCMRPGCDKEINAQNPLSEDHIIPLSKGGAHAFYNMQVLCVSCNCTKKDYHADDYREGRVLLGAHDPKFNLWDYMEENKSVTIKR